MQLGTNSVDTPRKDAVLSKVALQENDIVLALSDGVMDNLWEHEVQTIVQDSLKKWDAGHVQAKDLAPSPELSDDRMVYVARELLNAALNIAQDPFAESPYMEKAVDEGIAIEGGEFDTGWSMCVEGMVLIVYRQNGRYLRCGCVLSETHLMISIFTTISR
jgi:hypothetical protein